MIKSPFTRDTFCSKEHYTEAMQSPQWCLDHPKMNSPEMRQQKSDMMKEKIRNGEFTPCVTNSWARSRISVSHSGVEYKFRSSWEAVFAIINDFRFGFEVTRIPYIEEGETRNYIVDFTDNVGKRLIEIKPDSEKDKPRNILKRNAAILWCSENGFEYVIIDENWFTGELTEENVEKIKRYDDSGLIMKRMDKLCKQVK